MQSRVERRAGSPWAGMARGLNIPLARAVY